MSRNFSKQFGDPKRRAEIIGKLADCGILAFNAPVLILDRAFKGEL